MLYFAYGSNMDHSQMRNRCPESKYLGRAHLKDYRFVYDGYSSTRKGPVANVVPMANGTVWGGLFEISKSDRDELDRYEGYPTVYQRKVVTVVDQNGKEREAIVYLRDALKTGVPSKEYRDVILQGAKDCDLPAGYIERSI